MDEKLEELAKKLGILTYYADSNLIQQYHHVSDNTIRFFAGILGFKADTPTDVDKSLRKLEKRRWQYVLEPIYIFKQDHQIFDAVLPFSDLEGDFRVVLKSKQNGEKVEVSYIVTTMEELALETKPV